MQGWHAQGGPELTSRVVAWRLRQAGYDFAAASHDGTNAFASTKRELLQDRVDHGIKDGDKGLWMHRRLNTVIHAPAFDTSIDMQIGSGGLMGDGNAPDEFSLCYQVGLDSWKGGA